MSNYPDDAQRRFDLEERTVLAADEPNKKAEARVLWQEARELHLVFTAILNHRGKGKGDV